MPHTQQPLVYQGRFAEPRLTMTFVLRTAGDPMSLVSAARSAVAEIDRRQPVFNIRTAEQYMAEQVQEPRIYMLLLGIFGGIAVALSAVGIYGLMAYSVTQRTHEIGIRLALGAGAGDVLKLVVRHGLALILIGVTTGVAGALALTRLIENLLWGVKPADPLTFAAVSLLLIAVALLACYIPGRRATKVDPLVALRYE
ncbi:MAG: FtsX-like permease family protein [Acidobacteria bacterium]|nr:FtsX-like permease family protein [Acidobacteriota bacterium]